MLSEHILVPILSIPSIPERRKEEDDERFSNNAAADPIWGVSPAAKRKRKQDALKAAIKKDKASKGWFS